MFGKAVSSCFFTDIKLWPPVPLKWIDFKGRDEAASTTTSLIGMVQCVVPPDMFVGLQPLT
jgi:hypothetical protein